MLIHMHNLEQDVIFNWYLAAALIQASMIPFHLKFQWNCCPALTQLRVLIIYTPQAQESSISVGKGLALVDADIGNVSQKNN